MQLDPSYHDNDVAAGCSIRVPMMDPIPEQLVRSIHFDQAEEGIPMNGQK